MEITQSPQLDKLFKSLCQAQAKMDFAKKSSRNPFFKSKYADLTEVRKVAEVIHEFGLSISQFPEGENSLTTVLGHESGQFLMAKMTMKPVKNDPQGCGSALTYMRRYAMQSVLGIPSDDDDGNAATRKVETNHDAIKTRIYEFLKTKAPDVLSSFPPQMLNWTTEDWERAAAEARKLRG